MAGGNLMQQYRCLRLFRDSCRQGCTHPTQQHSTSLSCLACCCQPRATASSIEVQAQSWLCLLAALEAFQLISKLHDNMSSYTATHATCDGLNKQSAPPKEDLV